MSNTMTASHDSTIHYLDSVLNDEEKRCDQYSHQWRNFTISRSGRFRSKNKKRDVVDGKLFDGNHNVKENDKISTRNSNCGMSTKSSSYTTNSTAGVSASTATGTSAVRNQRDKAESYKSFYETNL